MTRTCPLTDKPKWFLYEIVSNKRTGIDCDKFDYFARDCANVGVNSNFDCRRYFQNVRILPVDGQLQLCVRDKEVFNLYELFHTRWSLHHRVYKHKTQAPIEDLLLKAFLKVDEVLHISESITDMERYTVLTDSIMYDILRNKSNDENVIAAQNLLKRIQRRDLYKFCGQTQPGSEIKCEADVIADALSEGSTLKADQVFVSIVNIHFGMKHNNPVDAVCFYTKSYQPMKVIKEQVSQILPQKFHERYVRVYAKSHKDSKLVQQCFEKWCSDNKCPVPYMLEGDRTGYFSPAFKLDQGSTSVADPIVQNASRGAGQSSGIHVRDLRSEFDRCPIENDRRE